MTAFSLVFVGAHDGTYIEKLVSAASAKGDVLLVEPVPRLFARLQDKYGAKPSIHLCEAAVAEKAGDVAFYAPRVTANEVAPWGDQLGSLSPTHAAEHDPRFADQMEAIRVKAITISQLLETYDVSAIDTLMLDTEGFDARILLTFPFDRLLPKNIAFEHKHSDGTFHIGPNFANCISMLDRWHYQVRILDADNTLAVLKNAVA